MNDGRWVTCYKHDCKAQIWLVIGFYEALQRQKEDGEFYCPHGHRQHFVAGETPEQKLRRERDRLAQQIAERDDEIRHQQAMRATTERQLSATKGVVTRIKNRVGHGVCPCCSRTFGNLASHMKSKHADYAKSDAVQIAAE